jgi:hypothetical protein
VHHPILSCPIVFADDQKTAAEVQKHVPFIAMTAAAVGGKPGIRAPITTFRSGEGSGCRARKGDKGWLASVIFEFDK